MAIPEVGDLVHVTVEGTVVTKDLLGFQIRENRNSYYTYRYDDPSFVGIKVVKKFRRAGDMINRNDLMSWAPNAGTVITQDGPITWMKIDRGMSQWVNSVGTYAEPSAMPSGDYRIEVIA